MFASAANTRSGGAATCCVCSCSISGSSLRPVSSQARCEHDHTTGRRRRQEAYPATRMRWVFTDDSYSSITMPTRQRRSASRSRKNDEEQWAEFADHVLEIAREIQVRGYTSPEAVSLTPSEGTVMRYLFPHPGALPSEVAFATGLQRSNLSAVLRGLEKKELIERIADPADGRSVRIHPTRKAIRNYATVRREWASAVAAAVDGEPDIEAALPVLAHVRAGLIRERQSAGRR